MDSLLGGAVGHVARLLPITFATRRHARCSKYHTGVLFHSVSTQQQTTCGVTRRTLHPKVSQICFSCLATNRIRSAFGGEFLRTGLDREVFLFSVQDRAEQDGVDCRVDGGAHGRPAAARRLPTHGPHQRYVCTRACSRTLFNRLFSQTLWTTGAASEVQFTNSTCKAQIPLVDHQMRWASLHKPLNQKRLQTEGGPFVPPQGYSVCPIS